MPDDDDVDDIGAVDRSCRRPLSSSTIGWMRSSRNMIRAGNIDSAPFALQTNHLDYCIHDDLVFDTYGRRMASCSGGHEGSRGGVNDGSCVINDGSCVINDSSARRLTASAAAIARAAAINRNRRRSAMRRRAARRGMAGAPRIRHAHVGVVPSRARDLVGRLGTGPGGQGLGKNGAPPPHHPPAPDRFLDRRAPAIRPQCWRRRRHCARRGPPTSGGGGTTTWRRPTGTAPGAAAAVTTTAAAPTSTSTTADLEFESAQVLPVAWNVEVPAERDGVRPRVQRRFGKRVHVYKASPHSGKVRPSCRRSGTTATSALLTAAATGRTETSNIIVGNLSREPSPGRVCGLSYRCRFHALPGYSRGDRAQKKNGPCLLKEAMLRRRVSINRIGYPRVAGPMDSPSRQRLPSREVPCGR
jgi:hypothetical protein